MQCVDTAERLLASDVEDDPDVQRHLAVCSRCAHVAAGIKRVEAVLASTLVVVPPLDLQQQLAKLAADAARPQPVPWWQRLPRFDLSGWLQQPQTVAAQGLAAVMLALASWQVFGWLNAFRPVVGDVGYAVELVASSPAAVFLGGFQLDLQSLAIWSVVGIGGWLVSEDGLIGRRLPRQRLP
jgi:hypothetical protein